MKASIAILAAFLPAALPAAETRRPNIIVILADDMGYSDPGCYGGEIPPPALDRLAREGVRLTRFQNCGMCVVSQASMLTGKWWPRWQQWWLAESGKSSYQPESSNTSEHYKRQGDRGTGVRYNPSAMPDHLSDRYPAP